MLPGSAKKNCTYFQSVQSTGFLVRTLHDFAVDPLAQHRRGDFEIVRDCRPIRLPWRRQGRRRFRVEHLEWMWRRRWLLWTGRCGRRGGACGSTGGRFVFVWRVHGFFFNEPCVCVAWVCVCMRFLRHRTAVILGSKTCSSAAEEMSVPCEWLHDYQR